MKLKIEGLRCIGLEDKPKKDERLLEGWEAEWLIENDFRIFEDLKKFIYYKLANGRYVWVSRLDNGSCVDGDGWSLDFDDGVRGVIVCKK